MVADSRAAFIYELVGNTGEDRNIHKQDSECEPLKAVERLTPSRYVKPTRTTPLGNYQITQNDSRKTVNVVS